MGTTVLDERFALHEHSYPALLTLKGYITLFPIGAHASVRRVKVESAVQRAKELSIDYNFAPSGSVPRVRRILLRRESRLMFASMLVSLPERGLIGTCMCRVYSNCSRLSLMGRWRNNGLFDDWHAELWPED